MSCNCKKTTSTCTDTCGSTPNFGFVVLILFILLAIIMGGII